VHVGERSEFFRQPGEKTSRPSAVWRNSTSIGCHRGQCCAARYGVALRPAPQRGSRAPCLGSPQPRTAAGGRRWRVSGRWLRRRGLSRSATPRPLPSRGISVKPWFLRDVRPRLPHPSPSPQGGISLSLDSAQAEVRRPAPPTSAAGVAAVAPLADGVVYCKTLIGLPPLGTCVVGDPAEPYGIGDYGPLRPEPAGVPCCASEVYPQPPSRQLWDRPCIIGFLLCGADEKTP
jgi:hypothetical protein